MTSKISSELEDKLAKMDDLVEDIKATCENPFANARGKRYHMTLTLMYDR